MSEEPKMARKPYLSIVLPVFNEAENLYELRDRLMKVCDGLEYPAEVIFVNDGSRDESKSILESFSRSDRRIRFVHFTRNFGHQQALMAGIARSRGKAVITMDADLQDPPELIPSMLAAFEKGVPVIYARRRQRKGEHWFKKGTAYLFYRLLRRITQVEIPLDTGDFRLISRDVVDELVSMPERNRFLRGQIAWLGFHHGYVDFDRDERRFGKTKYSLGKMIRFALDGITSFSNLPLQAASLLGFIFSGVAFLIVLYALYSKFVLNQVITGWTSLIISAMFIGGVQLLSVGIIGEYIGRIAGDVRRRPDFVIESESEDLTELD
jgi:polyisoprenyl-phosphate glycosyltransferase